MADSIDLLHYLDTLLKVGNFTKAAQQLYISQPYLTQVIKRSEQELGVTIVNRLSRPLQLTAAGELYYHHLKALELAQDDFKKQLYPFTLQNGKLLRIGILGTLGQDLLPRFLPEFLQRYPEVKLELVEDFADNNEKNAISGAIDFFIGQNSETVSQALKVKSTAKFGYVAVIPSDSKLYLPEQDFLTEAEFDLPTFLQEKLVLTGKGSSVRRNINFLFDKYSLMPQLVLETQNLLTAFNMAKSGLAGTIVPENMIGDEKIQGYNLFVLPEELISANFFLAYKEDKVLTPLELDLIALFVRCLA